MIRYMWERVVDVGLRRLPRQLGLCGGWSEAAEVAADAVEMPAV